MQSLSPLKVNRIIVLSFFGLKAQLKIGFSLENFIYTRYICTTYAGSITGIGASDGIVESCSNSELVY